MQCEIWKESANAHPLVTITGDYLLAHLRVDVLGLADVVMSRSGAWCLGSVASTRCTACRRRGCPGGPCCGAHHVDLELLSDQDMYMFFERGTRGGNAMVSTGHAVARNVSVTPGHGQAQEDDTWLLYLECNGLYGTAMSQPLPYSPCRAVQPRSVKVEEPGVVRLRLTVPWRHQDVPGHGMPGADHGIATPGAPLKEHIHVMVRQQLQVHVCVPQHAWHAKTAPAPPHVCVCVCDREVAPKFEPGARVKREPGSESVPGWGGLGRGRGLARLAACGSCCVRLPSAPMLLLASSGTVLQRDRGTRMR